MVEIPNYCVISCSQATQNKFHFDQQNHHYLSLPVKYYTFSFIRTPKSWMCLFFQQFSASDVLIDVPIFKLINIQLNWLRNAKML